MKLLRKLLKDEKGQGMVEYGIILALIAVVVIGAVQTLGKNTNDTFTHANQTIEGHIAPGGGGGGGGTTP
ncbi:MAG: Flp family type IVb pilin [Candidatus Sericytochromatia bacterium]